MRRICVIEECGAQLPEHGRSDLCANCRGMFRYWEKKPVARLEKYKSRLTKAQSRIARMPHARRAKLHIVGDRKHGSG